MSNRRITFQPDETVKCFEITIRNNNNRENTENFTVTVSPVAGDVATSEPSTTCVTITDDDSMSLVTILIHKYHIVMFL